MEARVRTTGCASSLAGREGWLPDAAWLDSRVTLPGCTDSLALPGGTDSLALPGCTDSLALHGCTDSLALVLAGWPGGWRKRQLRVVPPQDAGASLVWLSGCWGGDSIASKAPRSTSVCWLGASKSSLSVLAGGVKGPGGLTGAQRASNSSWLMIIMEVA